MYCDLEASMVRTITESIVNHMMEYVDQWVQAATGVARPIMLVGIILRDWG